MKQTTLLLAGVGLLAVAALPASADDWPQFRGPQRKGVSAETGWSCTWPQAGPKRLWSVTLGDCYAAPIVARGRVYVLGSTPQSATVHCLDAETGRPIWNYAFEHGTRHYEPDPRPNAPTATPLLDGDRLYVLGREGQLFCFDAVSGKVRWHIDLIKATGAVLQQFGLSSSPLVEKNLLLFDLGIGGAAVDKNTGRVVWKTPGAGGYASPVVYTRNGKREVALYTVASVVGVEAATGKELWRFPWQIKPYGAGSADPVVSGDTLLACSSQEGCRLLKLGGAKPTVVWANRNLCIDFTNSVLLGGYLYGNNLNKLACLDMRTGATRWEERGLGQGSLIAAGGRLIVLTERGELVIADATPEKYTERARTKLFDGSGFFGSAGFIAPVLADGRLYCCTSQGLLACLDLRKR